MEQENTGWGAESVLAVQIPSANTATALGLHEGLQ